MGLANCPQCGKLYLENSTGVCPACYALEEEAEAKVAAYLREVKKKATIEEIQEATGVEHKIILRMIKKGRLFSEFPLEYPCEHCGSPITEGRLCNSCSKMILEQLKTYKPHFQQEDDAARAKKGMYTKDIDK